MGLFSDLVRAPFRISGVEVKMKEFGRRSKEEDFSRKFNSTEKKKMICFLKSYTVMKVLGFCLFVLM
jgi:hypothetical protein